MLPKGMENWYATDFDVSQAGWKRGLAPFGQYMGKIPQPPVSKCSAACVGPMCYGATKVNSLWDKEVLLLRGTFNMPRVKEGHRYRLRVNSSAHVGNGCGYGVYINGKLLIEQPSCIGRGGGEKPKGAYITKEFLQEFDGGEVTIAVKSFLRFNDKYKVKPSKRIPQGRISLHFEEMKLPPMGDDLVLQSAALIPMLSSEWQAMLHSENQELQPDDHKFRWDGKSVANAKVLGAWTTIGQVGAIDEFTPEKKTRPRRPPFTEMTFKDNGRTGQAVYIWSGDTLMDLDRYQALKMKVKRFDGEAYLFIEAGGFSTRNPKGWQSPWYVMKLSGK